MRCLVSVTLSGTCQDSNGRAMPGVTIQEQETGVSTVSGSDGSWSMSTLNALGHTILGLWQGAQLGVGSIAARMESLPLTLVIDPYPSPGPQVLPTTQYYWSGYTKLTGTVNGQSVPLPGFTVLAVACDGQGNLVKSWSGVTDADGIASWTVPIDLLEWAAISSGVVYWRGQYNGRTYANRWTVNSVDSTAQLSGNVTAKYANTNFGTLTCFTQ